MAADGADLYDLDIVTGAATLVGAITPGTTDLAGMPNLAALPSSSTLGLVGLALVMGVSTLARTRLRRRA